MGHTMANNTLNGTSIVPNNIRELVNVSFCKLFYYGSPIFYARHMTESKTTITRHLHASRFSIARLVMRETRDNY